MATKPINVNKAMTIVYFNNLILGELRRNGINAWIAGGVLRDYFTDKPLKSDCDVFFPNLSEFNKAKSYLTSKGAKIIWESENGMKVTYKGNTFDLVKIFAPNPMDTIGRFDFTISMLATDGKEVYYGNNTLKDLQDRKLVINAIVNPLSTLKRVLKHYKKGFTMSAEETKKLYASLNSMPYDESDDLLSANGRRSSGEALSGGKPNVTIQNTLPPVAKPDYLKYAMIGVLALLVGYVAYKKFNKPQ
jgi:hypothetical protein